MSIRTKVIGCLLAVLFLFTGVSLFNYYRSKQTNQRLVLVNDLFLPLSRQIAQLQSNVQGLAEDMNRFYFQQDTTSTSENSSFSRMARDLYPYIIQKRFLNLERLLEKQEASGKQEFAQELAGMLARAHESFDQISASTDKEKFLIIYLELKSKLQAMSKKVDDECQKITLAAQAEGRESLFSSISLSVLVVLLGAISIYLSYRVLNPLPLFISSIKKIADGDFHQSLKVKASNKDEIALLAREYNRMLAALRERDDKIQRQQRELLQTERLAAVGQLSAEVVHEIRNPLNAMSLNVGWLESELPGSSDPEILKTIQSISREIERLNQITESYLVRARVPLQDQHKTPVNELIQEILDFEREEGRQIAIETELSQTEIYVMTDRSRLRQAFLNVLRNAREAMPRGGKLKVRTELADNVSRIYFTDTGHGMNEATMRGTFQPFFTTKANGTGLGLTLTKNIVEEAHGTVQCESEMGKGTTFTFQFPS